MIPWNVYLHYGDKAILKQQFESMKAWVDYIKKEDDGSGSKRLWTTGFQLGDWLALDGEDSAFPTGGTELSFIASAYYCYSAELVSKAAKVLGMTEISREYEDLSNEVRSAIRYEYFTRSGRLALSTQTALIVALFMDLAPVEFRGRVEKDLREKLKGDKNHLKTGFVGTPYLCRVLSESGNNDLAYTLLLNKDYPSWLYAVTMGATTIWERWNSVLPDGKISGTDMNSLNHYSYGSIVEWMFRNMAGINPVEDNPGFRHVKLAPQPDYRLKYVKASLNSAAGLYEGQWLIDEDGILNYKFLIPFNATATLILPDASLETVEVNNELIENTELCASQINGNVRVEINSGVWEFCYSPTKEYIKRYSTRMPLNEILLNQEAKKVLVENLPIMSRLPEAVFEKMGNQTLRQLANSPFLTLESKMLEKLDQKLYHVKEIFD